MASKTSHYRDVTYATQKGAELASSVGDSLTIAHQQAQGLSKRLSMLVPQTQEAIDIARTCVQLFLELDKEKNYGAEASLNVKTLKDNIDAAKGKAHSMRIYFPEETSQLHETLCEASKRADKLQQYTQNHIRYIRRTEDDKAGDAIGLLR